MVEEKRNRIWLIGGVVLLQVVMLIAAFWLGIYFERHIASSKEFDGQMPGQPGGQTGVAPGQAQGQQLPGGPQAPANQQLPPGLTEPPQVIGSLAGFDANGFGIITEQGPRPILIDEETYFRDHEGNTIALEDLQPGYLLAIYGNPDPARQALLATEVVLLPPLEQ